MADVDRLAVNLLWCVPGVVGGSEEYVSRQLVGLHDAAPDLAAGVELYALPGMSAAHPELADRYRIITAPVDGRRRSRRVYTEVTWLAGRSAGAHLVHHAGGTAPPRSPLPMVLTIHDLQYLDLPHNFSLLKRRYLSLVVPHSARRAAAIAVPSEFVAVTVVDAFGIEPERVHVVAHGVGPARDVPPADAAVLRARYRLGDGPVVVYPAITHPHKNHRFLVELLAGPWRDRDVTLVLTGAPGAADRQVDDAVTASGLADRVVRPGRVPAADRDGLIALADALLFPSEYEGFGAPVIEAMALGTPVVASDRAALPEVVGDAGLVRALDIDAWADVLDDVAAGRDRLVAAGRRRAELFTTDASGQALASVYRTALGR